VTPKQLNNVIALARLGLAQIAADRSQSEEAVAEISADVVAVKAWAKTYEPAPSEKPE